ncbi:hypothetical protein Q428_13185 [Fervidicella metallireducens AeB]|uniref:Uncharacterized protein n=1 Tax=Fervidicella metallireducens AeB TaxID=1403537 RepID=A0A017RS45_9CLOT|nr:DUF6345 domain-containing protein [Fervidicella metallireducens]EYE87462.1 hypothetical protein Q428_13185 [Fervidicella metallireducens AeB]
MFKKIIGMLMVGIILMSITVYAYTGKFATAYHGNGYDYDANHFYSKLSGMGWTNVYNSTTASNTVKAEDILNTAASKGADIVYYSTHGYSPDNNQKYHLKLYSGYQGSEIDRIYPSGADALADGYKGFYNYIGDEFISQDSINGYYTNSKWSSNLEWIVLACCNQLEDRLFDSNDGCVKYARTMCGYPERFHQILGYHGGAPDDTVDYKVADRFGDLCNANTLYIKDCWKDANEYYNNDVWAVIYHYDNRTDKLKSPTSDTLVMSKPNIYFQYSGSSSSILNNFSNLTNLKSGIEVNGHGGNRILVEVNNKGVERFIKSWPEINNKQQLDSTLIDKNTAEKVVQKYNDSPIKEARLIYYGGSLMK